MNVSFNINFHTKWGQTLYIVGSIPELGNWNLEQAKEMQCVDKGNWNLNLELPSKNINLEYRYFVKENNQIRFEEWTRNHDLSINKLQESYYILDHWQNRSQNTTYYSSAFSNSWFAFSRDNKSKQKLKSEKKIILKVSAPLLDRNESVILSGNQEITGNWDIHKAQVLLCRQYPIWEIELDSENIQFPFEYKFCIINNQNKSLVRWEEGENRTLNIPSLKETEIVIVAGLHFQAEEPNRKCVGLSIPVFSLKSENSFGIGDFGDLLKIVDWAKMTSQKIIQILPINDTTMTHTYTDSYPYNSISICALHPLYINIDELGKLNDSKRNRFYQTKQKELNQLSQIDYEQVDQWKWNFFREIFEQEGEKTLSSSEYIRFYKSNKEWLTTYAAYSYLRDKYQTPDFREWGDYSHYDKHRIELLCHSDSSSYQAVMLYCYLQFHAHKQLAKAREYAHKNQIVLKGDIPIGISRMSVEAWTEPRYFNMHFQAGAPPDDFSASGQNWGFPTYNWETMEEDNYDWWKKRFRKIADFFDAYRIDHILGFFRIWQIPYHSIEGLLGYFNPALPLSVEKIESGGFVFKKERFTQAYIHHDFLHSLFKEHTSEAKDIFLNQVDADYFSLQEPFDTQRKIQDYFADKATEKDLLLKKGLFAICNEVLFIEDEKIPNLYHPRISASETFLYKELSQSEKDSFDSLYWNYFYQRHNDFWKDTAIKHLEPIIGATNMLVCGEDLGMIPRSVPEVMEKLQMLSLEIERMPKTSDTEFTPLSHVPYLSVCTTSTHDMSTIRGWWKENREKTQRYYNQVLQISGVAPDEATPDICELIIKNHLNAKSMLTIIPFQDWTSINQQYRNTNIEEERINIPSNPCHYWRYRMHLSIDELLNAKKLNEQINNLICQ